jgi:hypothetical protein
VPPYSFSWDFGDGHSSSLQSPPHSYANPGYYDAIMTVTDSDGKIGSEAVTIRVFHHRQYIWRPRSPQVEEPNGGKSVIK